MTRSRAVLAAALVAGLLLALITGCEVADPTRDQVLCSGTPVSMTATTNNSSVACTTGDSYSSQRLSSSAFPPPLDVTCDYRESVSGPDLHMNLKVFRPAPPSSGPDTSSHDVVVYLHGGGWVGGGAGDIDSSSLFMARVGGSIKAQIARGWIVVSAEYRLAPASPFPAQLVDARAAINCAKHLPSTVGLTVDGDHVVVAGSSAGAHLAVLLGTTAALASNPSWLPEPSDPSTVASPPVGHANGGAGGHTSVHGAVSLDGPTNLANFDATPLPTAMGPEQTFEDLVGQLICGSSYRGGGTAGTCDGFEIGRTLASPSYYVSQLPTTPSLPPRLYLACAHTLGFPPAFDDCADTRAFFAALEARFPSTPPPNTDPVPCDNPSTTVDSTPLAAVFIDDTSTNCHADLSGLHGGHTTLDLSVNLFALNFWLDH